MPFARLSWFAVLVLCLASNDIALAFDDLDALASDDSGAVLIAPSRVASGPSSATSGVARRGDFESRLDRGRSQRGAGSASGTSWSSAAPAMPTDPFVSFRVRTWSLDEGVSTPVMNVAQTPDGYLWMTTFDGLYRFDGVRFQALTTETTPTFRQHDLLGLYVAQDGTLWTGGRDGWVYRRQDGEWTAFDIREIVGPHWVQGFAEDARGALWMVSTGRRVGRFDGSTWEAIDQPIRDVWTPLVADRGGTIWTLLAPEDAPESTEMVLDRGVVARWTGSRFTPVRDARSQGFVSTQNGPLFHHVRNPESLEGAGTRPSEASSPDRLRVELTNAAGELQGWFWSDGTPAIARMVDRSGRVWVQRMKDGALSVVTIERNGHELARIEPAGGTWIEQVFEDRQGNVWVHSRSSELIQVTEEPFRRFETREGAPRFAVRAVEAPDESVVVSTEPESPEPNVATIRGQTVTPTTFRLEAEPDILDRFSRNGWMEDGGERDRRIKPGHVAVDSAGQRWALLKEYLLRLDEDVALVEWASGGAQLGAILSDPHQPSGLWLAGWQEGIVYAFDTSRRAVVDSFRVEGGVNALYRDRSGILWTGTESGLWAYESDGTLRHISDPELQNRSVRGLLQGPSGSLWVATSGGGLVRLRDGDADAVRVQQGLPSDHLSAVLIDRLGFFWLSGRQALYRVSVASVNAVLDGQQRHVEGVHLLPSAGHLGSSNKLAQALHARDGSLWFPSFQGVTRIDPMHYAELYDEPLPLHIESVDTDQGTRLPLPDARRAKTSGIRVPVGERTLTVRYTAPELRSPSLVRFRTRLDGRDADWVDQEERRQVTYGGLPPGEYTFHVQAMNAGGIWRPSTTALTWTVPRTFTETWWFMGLCGLGVVTVGFIAFHLRVRSLKRRESVLNELVQEQTEKLRSEKQKVSAQAEALRSLDDAKSRVFANISHEFRTPLTLTLGPLDDLRDGLYGTLPSPMREQVELARRNASRVLDLVNQLLDVARLEAGEVRLNAQPVDIYLFVAGAVDSFKPLAERSTVSLVLDDTEDRARSGGRSNRTPSQPESVHVWGNPEQLYIVVSNLLSNAIKFTPEGGSVRVSLRHGGDAVTLSVRDSGPGIPSSDLPHVFDRFYRSDADHLYPTAGSGIGLALTKELVELHHGTISVRSEEGFGSEFTLTLPSGGDHLPEQERASSPTLVETFPDGVPRLLAPQAASAPVSDAPSAGTRDTDVATVLIVEDHAEVRGFIRAHLVPHYDVLEASNGREGLDRGRQEQPDLIISDVMMPEMDGFELCSALKEDPSTDFIPIILLTARAERDDRIDGLEHGADAYITKPFDVGELRARIGNLLRSRQSLQARFAETTLVIEAEDLDLPSADRTFIEQVKTAIEENLSDETFSVEQLAELVGLSRTHLYRRLQDLVDLSPSALIRTMRLTRARQMLEQDAASISEVAFAVGYKSSSHFSRSFRKHVGHTPSEYAEMTPTEL